MYVSRKDIEIRQSFSLEMTLNIQKRDLQFPKPYLIVKNVKHETFRVSDRLIWRQKWIAGVRHGNSLIVCRSPGKDGDGELRFSFVIQLI